MFFSAMDMSNTPRKSAGSKRPIAHGAAGTTITSRIVKLGERSIPVRTSLSREVQLRCQALNQPAAVRLFRIAKSIVQTIGLALPEFNPRRTQNVTAPIFRQRDFLAGKLFLEFCQATFDHFPVGDDF